MTYRQLKTRCGPKLALRPVPERDVADQGLGLSDLVLNIGLPGYC